MMKKSLIVLFILLCFSLASCKTNVEENIDQLPEENVDDIPDENIDEIPEENPEENPEEIIEEVYTITLENNNFLIDSIKVNKGDRIEFPNLDDTTSRVKYWTIKGESSVFAINTQVDSDLTLTPVFEYANVVIFANTKIKDIYVFPGEKIKKPNDPTLANYDFAGWYKDYKRENPFDFDKVYEYVQYINVYPKWEEVNSALYYRSGLAGNELYYAVYITEYATGEVVVPAYYLGVKIYEVYQTGETNSAIIISLPYTIDNVLPDFFIFSNDLEEIRVDTQNQMFRAVDGVLFKNPENIIFYPINKKGDTYHTDAKRIESKAFSYTKNLKNLFLDEVTQIDSDAFWDSNIENIIVSQGANISLSAFRNYNGNIFLNDDTYDFKLYPDIKVYLNNEWSLIDGFPVAHR